MRSEAAEILDTPAGTSPASAVETFSTEGRSDTQNLRACLDRLSTAVGAKNLKEKPRANDKKTTFATMYKKLADEFDKKLYGKHAGLFSTVSSTFMIQIQVERLPDRNDTTQAPFLITVLNMTSCSSAIQMFPWHFDLTMQFSLLLFATALSIYLWTIHLPLAETFAIASAYRPLAHNIMDRLVEAVERAVKRTRRKSLVAPFIWSGS
ncbi:hypothetical protein C8R44DRAFT_891748 [Mycena epipterygia]|nr:hypothetical protein C8R44DRAFT_891748 [Mycena epipterygia]